MSLGLVIVGGVVIISVVAFISDYLTKNVRKSSIDQEIINKLEKRVTELEQKANDQENKILSLQNFISFAN